MRKHALLRRISAFSFAFILFVYAIFVQYPAVSAESISDLRARLSKLEEERAENAARLERLREDIDQKREYRDSVKAQIDVVQEQLDVLVQRIQQLDDAIADGEQKIAETKLGIDQNFEKFKKRLRALYMAGEASQLEIILNAENIIDFTQKTEMLSAVAQHDTELITTLEDQLHSIEEIVAEINRNKEELSESKKELDAKSEELSALYEENQRLLEEAEQNEAEAQAEAERIQKEKEEADAAIDRWYSEYYAALEAANNNAGGMGHYVGTGNFIWPMPGYTGITCYFGKDGHRGIDISGSGIYGKNIVAADSGTVIYSGWMDSYGNCVFIDHGNGFSTRYAHASALACSNGEYVTAGQTIAYVGSTGNSTGPHLHFEILKNGSITDPFNYF